MKVNNFINTVLQKKKNILEAKKQSLWFTDWNLIRIGRIVFYGSCLQGVKVWPVLAKEGQIFFLIFLSAWKII
jgi:hypothetical protein